MYPFLTMQYRCDATDAAAEERREVMAENVFNVGDYVEVVQEPQPDRTQHGMPPLKGLRGVILDDYAQQGGNGKVFKVDLPGYEWGAALNVENLEKREKPTE